MVSPSSRCPGPNCPPCVPPTAASAAPPCRGECGQIGHGIHDATTEPAAVHALFAAAPWATGYGIACGRAPHHLIGLDLDVKNGLNGITALDELAQQHSFTVPETVTILTPSGGRHLWLAGPADVPVPNSVGTPCKGLAPGIDIRGSGGYLVGPGSLTTAGRYTQAPNSPHLPAAPVPGALLKLLLPAPPVTRPRIPRPATSGKQDVALVRFVLDSPEGQRNGRLYWAACRAFQHDGPNVRGVAAALVDAAVLVGLTESEARATVNSASRSASRNHA